MTRSIFGGNQAIVLLSTAMVACCSGTSAGISRPAPRDIPIPGYKSWLPLEQNVNAGEIWAKYPDGSRDRLEIRPPKLKADRGTMATPDIEESLKRSAVVGGGLHGPGASAELSIAFKHTSSVIESVEFTDLQVERVTIGDFAGLTKEVGPAYRDYYARILKNEERSDTKLELVSAVISCTSMTYSLQTKNSSNAALELKEVLKKKDLLVDFEIESEHRLKMTVRADAALAVAYNEARPEIMPKLPPPPPRMVEKAVVFKNLDVYLDGSPGKDTWSVWASVNGKTKQLWNRHRDVSDNGSRKYGEGPCGDRDATRYPLTDVFTVQLPEDGVLDVSFWGKAHDQNDPVNRSRKRLTAAENWGAGKLHKMGACQPGQTEYWVTFEVE